MKAMFAAYRKANSEKLKAKNAAYRAYHKEIKQLQEEAGFETTWYTLQYYYSPRWFTSAGNVAGIGGQGWHAGRKGTTFNQFDIMPIVRQSDQ